jgi:hypothetical protein
MMLALDFLQKDNIGTCQSDGVADFGQDKAPVKLREALVGVKCQDFKKSHAELPPAI